MAIPPAQLPPLLPTKDAKIEDMYTLSKRDIKERLNDANIYFAEHSFKYDLVALWAMYNLGLVTPNRDPDAAILKKVVVWVNMLVRDQLAVLDAKNLDVTGNKWDHIEVFVRAEFKTMEDKLAALRIAPNAPKAAVKLPSISAVHLLLASIAAELGRSESKALIPECPVRGNVSKLLRYIDAIPLLKDAATLTGYLQSQPAPSVVSAPSQLLQWICDTYGQEYIPATGSQHIKAWSTNVIQFVLNRPTAPLFSRFERCMSLAGGKSVVLYHGTALDALRSIVYNGFTPCSYDNRYGKGNFMAVDPRYAINYSWRRPGIRQWVGTPFRGFGVLLGCEVSGEGRFAHHSETGDVHVIRVLSSIMPRYIFLIPNTVNYVTTTSVPDAASVVTQMKQQFRRIRVEQLASGFYD